MKIAIVGTGYVGLVTGTCLAETGNQVTCIDIDENKVRRLEKAEITIYEPGLETIFHRNIDQGRLSFTTSLADGIEGAQVIFLALPTPPGEDGSADLSYVMNVSGELSTLISDYTVVVDKSTVPVGTAEAVEKILLKNLPKEKFDVVSNPEFLREGAAVDDFMKPDRVVIGSDSKKASDIMHLLYEPFVRQGNPIMIMDRRSAELTKYAANAYLATRISFMNEIANLCEHLGANVDMVRIGIGSDSRIGKRFLFPGVGYGGSCFPKDVQALSRMADASEYDFKILDAVMSVNDRQKHILVQKLRRHFNGDLKGKKIGIWGLAFKPNTDDIREAPAITIIRGLIEEGAEISAFDPEAMENMQGVFNDSVKFEENMYAVVEKADALAIITEWNVFRMPDFKKVREKMVSPVIFDGRNLYDPAYLQEMGFHYESIGRNPVKN